MSMQIYTAEQLKVKIREVPTSFFHATSKEPIVQYEATCPWTGEKHLFWDRKSIDFFFTCRSTIRN